MDERWNEEQGRSGPVRPPRPSHSLDYIGPSPRVSPRPSADMASNPRNRRFNASIIGASHLSKQLSPGAPPSLRYSGDVSTNGSERKGSFRNAVRKLFGKKTKEEPPQARSTRSPPGHGYHQSDPGFLTQTPPVPLPSKHSPPIPPSLRIVSAPLHHTDSSPSRVRSPSALHFPKSAQLKPLDLGNPFYHRINNEPKRRATLPTLNVANRENNAIGSAVASPPDSGMGGMGPDLTHPAIPECEIGLAVTTRAEKRRSRSANDLRQTMMQHVPARKRSDEIRFWRESFAGSVLLHPNTPPEEPQEIDPMDAHFDHDSIAPRAESERPLASSLRGASPVSLSDGKGSSAVLVEPRPATAGGERTEDLERRVTHLERSLQEFQMSLDRLTVGNRPSTLGSAFEVQRVRRQHTPSILVDTLQDPSWRPASLEQYPENARYEDAGEVVEREWNGVSAAPEAQSQHERITSEATMRPGTFSALYNMLSDERAARYRLETEVRDLQREVTTMATRLERGSWNSFHVPPLPGQHRPRTPDESVRGASSHSAYNPRIVSRFSGSDSIVESEIYGLNNSRLDQRPEFRDNVPTPYEEYRTPLEAHSTYGYGRDDEMF